VTVYTWHWDLLRLLYLFHSTDNYCLHCFQTTYRYCLNGLKLEQDSEGHLRFGAPLTGDLFTYSLLLNRIAMMIVWMLIVRVTQKKTVETLETEVKKLRSLLTSEKQLRFVCLLSIFSNIILHPSVSITSTVTTKTNVDMQNSGCWWWWYFGPTMWGGGVWELGTGDYQPARLFASVTLDPANSWIIKCVVCKFPVVFGRLISTLFVMLIYCLLIVFNTACS